MSGSFINYFQKFIYIFLIFSISEISSSYVTPDQTSSFEFETLTIAKKDGTTDFSIIEKSEASDSLFILYKSNAIGKFVTFPLKVNTAGTYNVKLRYQLNKYRGTFKAEVADNLAGPYTQIGKMSKTVSEINTFSTLKMTATFSTNGTKYLRITVIGSNPFTSSEQIGLDKVDLTLTSDAASTNELKKYIEVKPLRDLGFSEGNACFKVKAYTNTEISGFSGLQCKYFKNSNIHTLSWSHENSSVIGFLVYVVDSDTNTKRLLADIM